MNLQASWTVQYSNNNTLHASSGASSLTRKEPGFVQVFIPTKPASTDYELI